MLPTQAGYAGLSLTHAEVIGPVSTEHPDHDTLFGEDRPAEEEATPRLLRLQSLIGELEKDATAAHQARVTQQPRGVTTGLPSLDREMGGALPIGTTFLHAPPGAGKSAFALQVAATSGQPALLVSTEMGAVELFRRHIARETGTFLQRLKSGEMPPADVVALAVQAAEAAPLLVIADATRAAATPNWILQAAQAIRGKREHLLVVVDSVHSWVDGLAGGLPEYERLNAGVDSLRSLAQSLGCAVLGVAERNRASMERGGLSAGAGTRKLEYSGEMIWSLAMEEGGPDAGGERGVILTIEKNRNGAAGRKVALRFHGALQRFREAAR